MFPQNLISNTFFYWSVITFIIPHHTDHYYNFCSFSRIHGVLVSTALKLDHGFEPRPGQTKDYKIGILIRLSITNQWWQVLTKKMHNDMFTIFTLLFNHRSCIKEAHNIAVFTKFMYHRDTYYHHIYIMNSSQNQVMRNHIFSQYLHNLLFIR